MWGICSDAGDLTQRRNCDTISPMKYQETYEVSCHDVDVNNNMRPSLVLRYMQDVANHQMRDRKPSYLELFAEGKSFVLTRVTIEIFEQLHQYDPIVVSSWSCPGKGATFIRCYTIEREGKLAAKAYSEWAVSNRETGKLCKLSEVDISNYDEGPILDMSEPTRFRLPKDVAFTQVGKKHIDYSDVDMNLHMNNTNYPDMLWNHIPHVMEKEVTSINLRFAKEAPFDGEVDIHMGQVEDTYLFRTTVNGETNVEAIIKTRALETANE
ncbi:acyl-ACP thioesterase [Clostridiales Family XIII bacterium PM5-7]